MKDKTDKMRNFCAGLFEWFEELAVAIMFIVILFTFIFRVITVSGNSMFDNYHNGDRLIVSSITTNINQGDVVIVVDALDNPIIKRVIATEGQTVNIDNSTGKVFVNNVELDNTRFNVENGITFQAYYDGIEFPTVVPKGHVFVLGDNRGNSLDSRFAEVGMVPLEKVMGKSLCRIFPLNRFGLAP
ncbi:MAG: signal peptidase I [Clostridia bacterium]|nr:signal peptidase I [Clostridia bacterium]